VIFLFAAQGRGCDPQHAGAGRAHRRRAVVAIAVAREAMRLSALRRRVPAGARRSCQLCRSGDDRSARRSRRRGVFALRVAMRGNAAFASARRAASTASARCMATPNGWSLPAPGGCSPIAGGIVVGERYRVDKDSGGRARSAPTTERPGARAAIAAALLRWLVRLVARPRLRRLRRLQDDVRHVPTALKWGGSLVALDPSNEVAPMVIEHRRKAGRDVFILDPRDAGDRLQRARLDRPLRRHQGRGHGRGRQLGGDRYRRQASIRDDFFRASALQLITALIADVCLSGHTEKEGPDICGRCAPTSPSRSRSCASAAGDLRQFGIGVRQGERRAVHRHDAGNLQRRLCQCGQGDPLAELSELCRAGVGFELHNDRCDRGGKTDIFVNLDLKTLEAHPGLRASSSARLLNAIYNRNGEVKGRTLFLLDEVARLGYLRILETARDAGRKYGISLVLLFQSIGQMREPMAAATRPANGSSRRPGSRSPRSTIPTRRLHLAALRQHDGRGRPAQPLVADVGIVAHTRSKQLTARPLILPDEVLRMRGDEQIVFTAGNAPLRCGRAIWFRTDADLSHRVIRRVVSTVPRPLAAMPATRRSISPRYSSDG
jgi:type IV secretion system protein VirD4